MRGQALGEFVKSKIAHCGLHVVNTFSANYNKHWKEVDELLVRKVRAAAGRTPGQEEEDADDMDADEGVHPDSYDQMAEEDGGDEDGGDAGGGGSNSATDAKKGLWWNLHSGKSKSESKAMTYARWSYKSLSTCLIFREALAQQGVTMEWRRTMTARWGSREASMYYILLCEVLTSAFMADEDVVEGLKQQEKATLKAMHPRPANGLDPHLKYFFEASQVVEELYCKPLRVLACNPDMTPEAFQEICAEWYQDMQPLLGDDEHAQQLRHEVWVKGQDAVGKKMDEHMGKAQQKKAQSKDAVPDVRGFGKGSYASSRAGLNAQWPRSGVRDLILKKTLKGVADAFFRNIVGASEKAREMAGWTDAHLQAVASNNTLMVESIFSHMRRLEDGSKATRGPLMEAVIMAKLDPVSLVTPPKFLPAHMTTPAALRAEGREAEAGYGSRRKRGKALLAKAKVLAQERAGRREKRSSATAAKVVAAQESGGGKVYERQQDDTYALRELAGGERLTWQILLGMGPQLQAWLEGVRTNARELQWTDDRIKKQLTLINTLQKSTRLLKELSTLDTFTSRKKPIFGRDGDGTIPTTTGARGDKLMRLMQYVMAEARTQAVETGLSEFWRAATEKEISSDLEVQARPRRPNSQATAETRSATGDDEPEPVPTEEEAAAAAAGALQALAEDKLSEQLFATLSQDEAEGAGPEAQLSFEAAGGAASGRETAVSRGARTDRRFHDAGPAHAAAPAPPARPSRRRSASGAQGAQEPTAEGGQDAGTESPKRRKSGRATRPSSKNKDPM